MKTKYMTREKTISELKKIVKNINKVKEVLKAQLINRQGKCVDDLRNAEVDIHWVIDAWEDTQETPEPPPFPKEAA